MPKRKKETRDKKPSSLDASIKSQAAAIAKAPSKEAVQIEVWKGSSLLLTFARIKSFILTNEQMPVLSEVEGMKELN